MSDANKRQNFVLSRERSFVRPPSHLHYLYHPPILQKRPRPVEGKPTIELYRPPNVRADGTPLNVHAKEFTMNAQLLQNSRSSGNIVVMPSQPMVHKLKTSFSTPRVHFTLQSQENVAEASTPQRSPSSKQVRFQPVNCAVASVAPLQRSKSVGAADVMARQAASLAEANGGLGAFPQDVQNVITVATQDPNTLPPRVLMDLVRGLMERVLESRHFAEAAAKICIKIIENERKETFLESLLNICQQWYQEREKVLKTAPSKMPAFLAFLNEMYCQLKRRQLQLKTQQEGVAPGIVLLTLLSKCCQDCLQPPTVGSLAEMESLFFVLTAIGKDLQQELPSQLDALMTAVRDAFLTAKTLPAIRKTLLQLIELSAAKWQLPAPAVRYYYPGTFK